MKELLQLFRVRFQRSVRWATHFANCYTKPKTLWLRIKLVASLAKVSAGDTVPSDFWPWVSGRS